MRALIISPPGLDHNVQAAITQAVANAVAAATPTGMGPNDLSLAADQTWVVYTATLVLFMQAGFAMLEVRRIVSPVYALDAASTPLHAALRPGVVYYFGRLFR